MLGTVEIPLWLLVLILAFAAVTFASHFLFPSVRWFFRRRMERAVARLNTKLAKPIEPFKLLEHHDRVQQLVYDPEVLAAVVAHARANGVPRSVAFQQARRYASEIVPGFSASVYFGFSVRIARWLSQLLYSVRVFTADETELQAIDPDATVVFIINHRSNMDYVLVTWLVSNRMTLSYAVGEWARVWPLSWLIRAMGAYFIRRKHLNPLYRKVLERYVQIITAEGVTQAIFPEGGLSLNGQVGTAKLGLLGDILAHAQRGGRPVVFVPVGLGYDRVIEDRALIQAHQTGIRRFQIRLLRIMLNLTRLIWLRSRGKWGGFGTAAVSFGRPVALSPMLQANPALDVQGLADRLMAELRSAVPVAPLPLIAAAILRGASTRQELGPAVSALRLTLESAGAVMAIPDDPPEVLITRALAELTGRSILAEHEDRFEILDPVLLDFQAAPVQQMLNAVAAKWPQLKSDGT